MKNKNLKGGYERMKLKIATAIFLLALLFIASSQIPISKAKLGLNKILEPITEKDKSYVEVDSNTLSASKIEGSMSQSISTDLTDSKTDSIVKDSKRSSKKLEKTETNYFSEENYGLESFENSQKKDYVLLDDQTFSKKDALFRYAHFECGNGASFKLGSESSCKSVSLWTEYAEMECRDKETELLKNIVFSEECKYSFPMVNGSEEKNISKNDSSEGFVPPQVGYERKADMNRDGKIDFDDIDWFTMVKDYQWFFSKYHPDLFWIADIDNNGKINEADVDLFVALLG